MSRLSQKSSLNLNYNDEDTTNNDDDDAVSDVDPEELQKMLEVSYLLLYFLKKNLADYIYVHAINDFDSY